jgi:hypothetical protein
LGQRDPRQLPGGGFPVTSSRSRGSAKSRKSAATAAITRYEAQIAQAIPAADAGLRAAIMSAITLGITISRHLIKSDELVTADPAHVIERCAPACSR